VAQLGLDLGLLLSQLANFVVLALILSLVLYRPVLDKLSERADRIRKGVEDADQAAEMLAQATKEHQQQLADARAQAREIIEQATRTGEQQRQEILAQARQDAQQIIQRAHHQAARETIERRVALSQQVVDIAMASTERLLESELTAAKQHDIIGQVLAQAEAELVALAPASTDHEGTTEP